MRIWKFCLSVVCALFLWGCQGEHQKRHHAVRDWMRDNGKIKTLSTTGIVGELVAQVGGEWVDNLVLIQGELDPHSYQLVKGDDEKFARADLVFSSGLGLEHGPSLKSALERSSTSVSLGDRFKKEYPDRVIFVAGQQDPHLWMDLSLWSKTIPYVVNALSERDPAHADVYAKNGENIARVLGETHRQVQEMLAQIPLKNRYLVTSHDAFNYFTRAYLATDEERASGAWRSRFSAPEGLAPESQLSLVHVQEIVSFLKQHEIRWVFPESNVSRDSILKLVDALQAQERPVQVICCPLYGDALGPVGSEGETHQGMLLHNARMLVRYLHDG